LVLLNPLTKTQANPSLATIFRVTLDITPIYFGSPVHEQKDNRTYSFSFQSIKKKNYHFNEWYNYWISI